MTRKGLGATYFHVGWPGEATRTIAALLFVF